MDIGFGNDPHSERGHSCPKNVYGYTDYRLLQPIEAALVQRRALQLEDGGVTGAFDVPHLQEIHRFLFRDVFPWAGQFRVVNISKGSSNFGNAAFLDSALTELLAKLKAEDFFGGLSSESFAKRAAFYLGEINAIHPFREGNGRTQREFIRQLGLKNGHEVVWAGFTQEQMTRASILSHTKGDASGLEAIIQSAIVSPEGDRE